jgi:hypothetical protein
VSLQQQQPLGVFYICRPRVSQERQQQLTVFRGRMPAELQESAWWLDARSQVPLPIAFPVES